jgi:hypothetical protein
MFPFLLKCDHDESFEVYMKGGVCVCVCVCAHCCTHFRCC